MQLPCEQQLHFEHIAFCLFAQFVSILLANKKPHDFGFGSVPVTTTLVVSVICLFSLFRWSRSEVVWSSSSTLNSSRQLTKRFWHNCAIVSTCFRCRIIRFAANIAVSSGNSNSWIAWIVISSPSFCLYVSSLYSVALELRSVSPPLIRNRGNDNISYRYATICTSCLFVWSSLSFFWEWW